MKETEENSNCNIITKQNILESYNKMPLSHVKCKYIHLCIKEIIKQTIEDVNCKNDYKMKSLDNGNYVFSDKNFEYNQLCVFDVKTKEYYDILKNHLINLQKLKTENPPQFYHQLNLLYRNCPALTHFIFQYKNINNLLSLDYKYFEKAINDKYKYMFTFNHDKKIAAKINGGANESDAEISNNGGKEIHSDQDNDKKIYNEENEFEQKNRKINFTDDSFYILNENDEEEDDFIIKNLKEKMDYYDKNNFFNLDNYNDTIFDLNDKTIKNYTKSNSSKKFIKFIDWPEIGNSNEDSIINKNTILTSLNIFSCGFLIFMILSIVWLFKYKKDKPSNVQRQAYNAV